VPVEVEVQGRHLHRHLEGPDRRIAAEECGVALGHGEHEIGLADHAKRREIVAATQADVAAQAALAQAQEMVYAQRGFFFPSIGATYQAERHKIAGNLTNDQAPGIQGNGDNLSAPLQTPGIAPYTAPLYYNFQTAELTVGFVPDVFGSNRRQVESLAAQTEAQRVRSAFSLAMVHGLTCAVYWSLEVRPALAEHAAAGMTLSIEHGFPHHIAQCMVWRGWALAGEGQIESGLSLLREGVARYRQTESLSLVALFLAALGEAAGRAGKLQEGHDAVVEALSIVARTEERCIEPELHRLQGGLFRLLCQEQDAEACLHRAITIAREQGAKLWELRAVTSLARLWRDQGKRGEALDVLAPIYNWFTEGLDTPVLKEAKALLEELSDSPFVISARPA